MSALNATYDVIWGVPDGEGLDCSRDPTAAGQQLLPTCVNTSFPALKPRVQVGCCTSPVVSLFASHAPYTSYSI